MYSNRQNWIYGHIMGFMNTGLYVEHLHIKIKFLYKWNMVFFNTGLG